jgi:HK97 family phage prohead protease
MKKNSLPSGIHYKDFRASFLTKAAADGTFSGLAAAYGNVDDGGDVIEAGAFKEFEFTKNDTIRVLYQHDSDLPMGQGKVSEAAAGLQLDAKLNLNVPRVAEAHEFMKDGVLDGLSIGYTVLPGGASFDKGVRRLTGLKLWEVSVVTFGMNTLARIEAVKSMIERFEKFGTARDLEKCLRDVGFSNRAAKLISAGGFQALRGERDVRAQGVLKELRELVTTMKTPAESTT